MFRIQLMRILLILHWLNLVGTRNLGLFRIQLMRILILHWLKFLTVSVILCVSFLDIKALDVLFQMNFLTDNSRHFDQEVL
jgi:hypothetical protein